MERYIKAKDVKKRADCYLPEIRNAVANILRHTKTADVVEQKQGEWRDFKAGRWIYAQCSECKTIHNVQTNYCSTCGAKMQGGKIHRGTTSEHLLAQIARTTRYVTQHEDMPLTKGEGNADN